MKPDPREPGLDGERLPADCPPGGARSLSGAPPQASCRPSYFFFFLWCLPRTQVWNVRVSS
jgi:hypothetical protein